MKFVVTITTDLGDAFLPDECYLFATAGTGGSATTTRLRWPANARALPVRLSVERPVPLQPLRISIHSQEKDLLTDLNANCLPDIVSVSSAEIAWPVHEVTAPRVERRFLLASAADLHVWEDTGDSIARHVWDGGLALMRALAALQHGGLDADDPALPAFGKELAKSLGATAEGSRLQVIELGAGCGMVGIALAQLFEAVSVLLTDLPNAMDLLRTNAHAASPAKESMVDVQVLDWDDESAPSEVVARAFDLVIISECTYNSDSIPSLVRVIAGLAEVSPNVLVLLSTKPRHDSEEVFFQLMIQAGMRQLDKLSMKLPSNRGTWRFSDHVDLYLFQSVQAKAAA